MPVSSTQEKNDPSHTGSVTDSILDRFFHAMRVDADLATVEPALRKVVMADRVFAEAAIRAALLPDTQ